MKNNKRALIASSSGVQDQEFIYPYFRLLEENFKVDVFLLEEQNVTGYLGTTIPPIKNHQIIPFKKIDIKKYNLLVLPGGVKSMEKLRQFTPLINLISEFDKKSKVIACICSATQLLISARVVKNRKISGYYSMEDDIVNAGGIYTDKPAVIDKNIITTAHYKDLGPWMKAVLDVFYNNKSNA